MATFAQYILSEHDFVKKIDIANYLRKKQNTYFTVPVILKAEVAREFIDTMKIDIDKNLVLTACLLFDCLKYEKPTEDFEYNKTPEEYTEHFKLLGFSDKFCKICDGHTRVNQAHAMQREKESDILELVDQFGGLISNRSDRVAYEVDEALEILLNINMKDSDNVYLGKFQEFVEIMEDIDGGLLTKLQKNMNCIIRTDIPSAVREVYDTIERNEEAFAKREKELIKGGDLYEQLQQARLKIKLFEEAPLLPGFDLDDLEE